MPSDTAKDRPSPSASEFASAKASSADGASPAMATEAARQASEQAAALIAQAGALVVAAGAGIGVDSGLPDFRGTSGFWRAYPALGAQGMSFAEIANPANFETRPRLAWGFYGHRLALYRRTVPHAGFHLLQKWASERHLPLAVFTSNVDGQFQAAGFDQASVYECHGSIHWLQCTRPCGAAIWPATELVVHVDEATCEWRGPLPTCPHCGALARPNILMFGDWAWLPGRSDEQERRLQAWLAQVQRPVVVEIGAGVDIATVRHFSRQMLSLPGAHLLRINPREPAVSRPQDVALACGALAGLQAVEAALARV